MSNLISIIVPVYNVEKYLNRCVDSLIHQSYSNVEIILVDDGSTDLSGKLCDELAKLDDRIIVLHKVNGGLSDARNYGVSKCSGDYVLFVDSDDYVDIDICKETLEIALTTDADMVSFKAQQLYECSNKKHKSESQGTGEISILTSKDAGIRYLYGDGIQHSAWSKLYKRDLLDKVVFPVGMLAEDFATTYLFISNCRSVAIYDKRLYVYCIRKNSIMGQASFKLVLDVYKSACLKYEFGKENFPEHRKAVETEYCNCLLKTIARIYNEKDESKLNEQREIEARLRKIQTKYIPFTSKCALVIYRINKKCFAVIVKGIGFNG